MLDIINIDINKLIHIKSVYRYSEEDIDSDVCSSHSDNSYTHFLFYEQKLIRYFYIENDDELKITFYTLNDKQDIFNLKNEYLSITYFNNNTCTIFQNYLRAFEYENINQKNHESIDNMYIEIHTKFLSLLRKNKIEKILR